MPSAARGDVTNTKKISASAHDASVSDGSETGANVNKADGKYLRMRTRGLRVACFAVMLGIFKGAPQ
jgi:hypothetical protein